MRWVEFTDFGEDLDDAIGEAVERAQAYDQTQTAVIYDGFSLRAIILAEALRGSSKAAKNRDWKDWMKKHASHAVDFAADRRDWVPGLIHALSETYLGLRALPRFLRATRGSAASAPAESAERAS